MPDFSQIPSWLPIAASLLGGGFMGSVLTHVVTYVRNRQQSVGRRVDFDHVLRPRPEGTSLRAQVAIHHGDQVHNYDNLFIAYVKVVNRGNRDLDRFSFGVNLSGQDRAVFVECRGVTRLDQIRCLTPVSPIEPASELDFECGALPRGRPYWVSLFVVVPDGAEEPQKIEVISSEPVVFIDMPTLEESAVRVLSEVVLSAGPLMLRLR